MIERSSEPSGIFTLTAGDGRGVVSVDMGKIARDKARQAEIAFVTRDKAKELFRALNWAYLDVKKQRLEIERHRKKVDERIAIREATIVLNELPKILIEKGISQANAEVRKAAFALDNERQELLLVRGPLEALEEILKIEETGFRNTMEAAKKAIGSYESVAPGDLSHPLGTPPGKMPVTSYQENGTFCPVCEMVQYRTPDGLCCAQGHGF